MKKESIGDRVIQLYNNARNAEWYKYQNNAQKWYEFYLGEQLSDDELSMLRDAGMPTFIVNKITPGVTNLKYYVTANNPSFLAVARDGKSTNLAEIHADVLSYNFYISEGKAVQEQVVTDSIVKGCGCYQVYVDKEADAGRGEVKFGYTNYRDIFVDSASCTKFWDDAKWILVRKYFTRGTLKNMFPDLKKIDSVQWIDDHRISYSHRSYDDSNIIQPEDISWVMDSEGREESLLPVFELYEKVKVPLCRITLLETPDKNMLKIIEKQVQEEANQMSREIGLQMEDRVISLKEDLDGKKISQERFEYEIKVMQMQAEKQLMEFQAQKMEALISDKTHTQTRQITKKEYEILAKSSAFKDKIIDVVEFNGTRIKYRAQIGKDLLIREDMLPTDKYPIVPVYWIYTNTPYPISLVGIVKGKQEEITKAHQIALHNANLASNFRILGKAGTFGDKKDEWRRQFTSPGSVNEYYGEKPEIQLPQNITNSFTELILKEESDLEELIGSNSVMRGAHNPDNAPWRGVMSAEELGSRGIKTWVSNMYEPALERLGQVLTDFDQAVYKNHKIFRITNPETLETRMLEINKPMYGVDGKQIAQYFDYDATAYDIRIISGSTLPVNRFMKLNMAIEMYELGIVTRREVIEQSDFKDKERILAELSEIEQLRAELENTNKQVKDLSGDIQTYERELTHLRIKEKVGEQEKVLIKHLADFDARYEKELANLRADIKIMRDSVKKELEM